MSARLILFFLTFTDFSKSVCVLRVNDCSPKDPWSKSVPLPNGKMLHYDPDIRPGTEKWHEPVDAQFSGNEKFEWPTFNDRIHAPDGTLRPAYVCHMRTKIKYSNDKMWWIASFVRGMTVDQALKELKFVTKKGARVVEDVIEEARQLALKEHHFEYATNMWVAESFCDNFDNIKGIRRHGRGRITQVKYGYISYFVRLEEGRPPQDYYNSPPKSSQEWLEQYVKDHRSKYIHKF